MFSEASVSCNLPDDEVSRVCPLCQTQLRYFFIHFNKKMLMCQNIRCKFPFGCEELQYIKEDNDFGSDDEIDSSNKSMCSKSVFSCPESHTTQSEIDNLNQLYKPEDVKLEVTKLGIRKYFNKNKKKLESRTENEVKIQKNVDDLKGLTQQLNEFDNSNKEIIKNKEWIKNLMNIQGLSGVQLLEREEVDQLKIEEPYIGGGELKIDIDRSDITVSSIKIEINKTGLY